MDDRGRRRTSQTGIPSDTSQGLPILGRNLAASLDTLVRSARTNPAAVPNLIERTLDYWRKTDGGELEILPTGIRYDETDVFTADEEEGRWLLPAFMAGLRALRPWTDLNEEQLRILASELADLSGHVEDADRFRDWLWADGAEGFHVSLDLSFSEGIDTAFDDLKARRRSLAGLRVEAARALSEHAQRLTSEALDAAAALPELQVDLAGYAVQAGDGSFLLNTDEKQRLQAICNSPVFWAEAQADVALTHPALQPGLPAPRLAEILMRELASTIDMRVVDILSRLGSRTDPYARSLIAALQPEPLGYRIASGAPMNNQGVRALAGLMISGPLPIGRGVAQGLIERAAVDREAFTAMKQIASSVVFQRFYDLLNTDELSENALRTLGLLALRCKDPVRMLPRYFDGLAPEVAIEVLGQTPSNLLWEARPTVGLLLSGQVDSTRRRQLVRTLVGTGDKRWLSVLARALSQSKGRDWCPATLRVTCDKLAAGGFAEKILVPLVHDTETTEDAVLAALRALEQSPDALREATKFHFRELTHSKDVRQRLRKMRRRLKEGG